MEFSEPLISWEIEEYPHKEKGPDWFWALGVIVIAGAATAIIFHDVLFGIFLILAGIILGFYAARKPKIIDITINKEGIEVRDIFYPFKKIVGFAVDEHDLGNHLLIEVKRPVTPVISIRLPYTIDPESLRDLLSQYISEKELKEEMTHRIMEHMGF